jgi:hypothetical protein
MALAHTVPYLAATLAFITYTRVTNEFDVAVVFASLALFQVRVPAGSLESPS